MQTPASRFVASCVVVLALLSVARDAEACSCLPPSCGNQASYTAVFEATVDALVPPPARPDGMWSSADLMTVRLRDLRTVRGDARDEVVTPQDDASCGYPFKAGTRYLIFARRSSDDGRLIVVLCGLTRPVGEAAGLMRYLESLSAPSKGGRVWGRVAVPTASGMVPLASARVALSGAYSTETLTGATGEFELTELPPGSYSVTVTAPDRPELSFPTQEARLDEAYACSEMMFWPRIGGRVEARGRREGLWRGRDPDLAYH